jgi:hypothetical protein
MEYAHLHPFPLCASMKNNGLIPYNVDQTDARTDLSSVDRRFVEFDVQFERYDDAFQRSRGDKRPKYEKH